jgi:hypothetical protein
MRYLIESMEHTYDKHRSWWRPDRLGYTNDLNEAGRYTEVEAAEICEKAGPENERMWRETDVLIGKAGKISTVILVSVG